MLSIRKHGEFDKYTKENFTKCHLLTFFYYESFLRM